jgi:hypothetical protein
MDGGSGSREDIKAIIEECDVADPIERLIQPEYAERPLKRGLLRLGPG